MNQGSKAGHLPQLPKILLLLPYLTLNKPGFSESSKVDFTPCVTSYFKLLKALPATNKTFDDIMINCFYEVILYFMFCSDRKK